MVVFDSTVLILLLYPEAKPPIDPATKAPLTDCKARIEFLISKLSESKTPILIPTPVLSEVLVRTRNEKSDAYFDIMRKSPAFQVEPFDSIAAVELAHLIDEALASKKELTAAETWAKVKYDRQIIAVAKTRGCTSIYCGDGNLAAVASKNGMKPIMTWELPLPPVNQQQELKFDEQSKTDPEPGRSAPEDAELAAAEVSQNREIGEEESEKETEGSVNLAEAAEPKPKIIDNPPE
ncbi:MAG: type II toxin-antitoxin system VapC family toxin [Gammaproteobacteria bacterium]|nr:type II toxin-antitoxin system VapC family toxin [Gammaproteobacteria bacterium]